VLTPRGDTPPATAINLRTLRVPCAACVDGYFIPWHHRDGSLFYKCVLCETPLDFPTHRTRKAAIVDALEDGRAVACFFVSESVLPEDRPHWKPRRRRKRARRAVALNA